MRVGVFQFEVLPLEYQTNLRRIREGASHLQVDLLILPELCTSGYLLDRDQAERLAIELPGDGVEPFEQLARHLGAWVIAGVIEKSGAALYNTALVVGPEGWVGKQRKLHITRLESALFQPGTELETFQLGVHTLGIVTCFDAWFPEVSRRLVRRRTADPSPTRNNPHSSFGQLRGWALARAEWSRVGVRLARTVAAVNNRPEKPSSSNRPSRTSSVRCQCWQAGCPRGGQKPRVIHHELAQFGSELERGVASRVRSLSGSRCPELSSNASVMVMAATRSSRSRALRTGAKLRERRAPTASAGSVSRSTSRFPWRIGRLRLARAPWWHGVLVPASPRGIGGCSKERPALSRKLDVRAESGA